MSFIKDPTRRTLLTGAGGLATLASIGMPASSRLRPTRSASAT